MLCFFSFSVYIYEGIYNTIKSILSSFKYVNKVVLYMYMKRIIPLLLAVLILSACGAPAAAPSPTPTPEVQPSPTHTVTPSPEPLPELSPHLPPSGYPWPEFVAGPAEGGYTFRSEELGFSFTVPAEVSHKVAVSEGVEYWDPDGPSFTVYYVPENGRYPITLFYVAVESPRAGYFHPGNWYYGARTSTTIEAMSECSAYITQSQMGGSEIGPKDPLFDDYLETSGIVGRAISDGIVVDEPSSVPKLDTTALPVKAGELVAKGDATMTRAEAAQLAFDLLTAANKDEVYPLDYADVSTNSEYAHAIAYLDSYGLLTRYSRGGEDLDGNLFRPNEPITRAEFAMLLHRLSFKTFPHAYAAGLENIEYEYWASPYVNYAWHCGWLGLDENGDIRPDEPITTTEAAQALFVVAEIGYPTPGVDFE